MNVFIFPGQGAQFPGMGLEAYKSSDKIKSLFNEADEILGFKLSKVMFEGTEDELKQTKVTQPAIFLHSIAELYLKTIPITFNLCVRNLSDSFLGALAKAPKVFNA